MLHILAAGTSLAASHISTESVPSSETSKAEGGVEESYVWGVKLSRILTSCHQESSPQQGGGGAGGSPLKKYFGNRLSLRPHQDSNRTGPL